MDVVGISFFFTYEVSIKQSVEPESRRDLKVCTSLGVSVLISDGMKFRSVNEVVNEMVRDFSEIERADALRTTSP